MFGKKLLLISILILFILNIGLVFASDDMTNMSDDAETDSVENSNIILTSGNSWSDIRESVDMANENDTIELEGTYSGDGKVININKSLTFQGKANATFDAQGKSGIFNISSSNVLFKNITFMSGYGEIAGAIYSRDSSISFIDCSFRNNTCLKYGGSINSDNGALSILNSTFINNTAKEWGGAIYSYGFESGPVSIIGSTFINNTAKEGGAIRVSDEIITSMSIVNSTFISNSAETGGAISNEVSNLLITCSTFISNTASYAGAVSFSTYWHDADCSIANSVFMNNSAKEGGALMIDQILVIDVGYSVMSDENVTLKNNAFKNNYANRGGAIYAVGNINMDDTIFENNTAESIGSIIFNSGISNIKRCSFLNNANGNIYLTTLENHDRYEHEYPSKLTIEDSVYENCVLLDNDLNPTSAVNVNVTRTTFVYDAGEVLTIQLSDRIFQNPISGNLTLKIGSKTYDIHANSTGIATFEMPDLNVGKHSVVVMHKKSSDVYVDNTHLSIIIKKAKTTVKAPKVTGKFKKSTYLKVKVTHKTTGKPVKNTHVKVKIDKKTYQIKTNSKGVAKFNTKKLKVGKHNVKITSGDSNYQMSAKSTIKIK